MNRGDLWWVRFGQSKGGEIRKTRPAIIVSNNSSNRHLNRVQVVPLASRTEPVYPSEAIVTLAGKYNKAMADQLVTVSKRRLIKRAGNVSLDQMKEVDRVLKVQLGLG